MSSHHPYSTTMYRQATPPALCLEASSQVSATFFRETGKPGPCVQEGQGHRDSDTGQRSGYIRMSVYTEISFLIYLLLLVLLCFWVESLGLHMGDRNKINHAPNHSGHFLFRASYEAPILSCIFCTPANYNARLSE